jgi:hypothetical protein
VALNTQRMKDHPERYLVGLEDYLAYALSNMQKLPRKGLRAG